jgi:hypothetical protein
MPRTDIELYEPTLIAPDPTCEDGFDEWADEIDDRDHPSGYDTAEEYRGLR